MFGNNRDRDDRSSTTEPRNSPASSTSTPPMCSKAPKPSPDPDSQPSSQNWIPSEDHDDSNQHDPNPFVAFRQSTDRLITHVLSTAPTLSEVYSTFKSQLASFDSDRAMSKFTESYERSTDPQRTGAAAERKTQAQREKEMEERENRRKEWENAANQWVDQVCHAQVPLPDRDTFNFSFGWPALPGQVESAEGSWPFGRGMMGAFVTPWMDNDGEAKSQQRAWCPSLEWMIRDRYSPLMLETGEVVEHREKWRRAFEELLESQEDRSSYTDIDSHEQRNISAEIRPKPTTQEVLVNTNIGDESVDRWLGSLIKRQLVSVHRWQQVWKDGERDSSGLGSRHDLRRESGQRRSGYHPWALDWAQEEQRRQSDARQSHQDEAKYSAKEWSDAPRSNPSDDHASPAISETRQRAAANEDDDNDDDVDEPWTELEMYERFLRGESIASFPETPQNPKQDEVTLPHDDEQGIDSTTSQRTSTCFSSTSSIISGHDSPVSEDKVESRVIGTSTSTATRVLPDGTRTTKTVVRRRFADGREEVEEKSRTGRLPGPRTAVPAHEDEDQDESPRNVNTNSRMRRRVWDISAGEEKEVDEPVPREREDAPRKSNSWFWSRD